MNPDEPVGPHSSGPGAALPTGAERLHDRVAAIATLPRATLVEQWISRYGQSPPKGLSRRLLEHAVANALQAKVSGGLNPTIERKLQRLAGSGHVANTKNTKSATTKDLPAGSRLVREWNGRTCTVDVLETGFSFDGQNYRSLSEIARAITGARWSGPRFFGLCA